MTTKIPLHKIVSSDALIAATNIKGGEFVTDLHTHWLTLYRSKNGEYFVAQEGGAGVGHHVDEWLTRDQAIDWIASIAEDSITGYGYSHKQAEIMIDGDDAGPGYRENPDDGDDAEDDR